MGDPRDAAAAFLRAVEEREGEMLNSQSLTEHFRPRLDHIDEASKELGKHQVDMVRKFVKEFSPLLGKPEWGVEAPLHDVLERADFLLGLEDEDDQDLHPYRKAASIMGAMREFMETIIAARGDHR